MIYYSILYPPLLPISIPAFELKEGEERWRLYFDTSVGNRIEDFRGGFIRIRRAESEVSIFDNKDGANSYFYDFVPFRNPFAEYLDPYGNSSEFQPSGYPENMPSVNQDSRGTYYIDIPHKVFSIDRGHIDQRFKVQMMLTTDWISSENEDGSGAIQYYNRELSKYVDINKDSYFGGNLVEKGLSEWSRVTLVSPVSEAKYELQFERWGETSKGYLNSPIVEILGAEIRDGLGMGNSEGNKLKAYRIDIYTVEEGVKKDLHETSDWIVGQENPNMEIRWQNEVEFIDKTNYIIELQIQTLWELRKTFVYEAYTNFESSIFVGEVEAINDHDKARVKVVISAKSPLTWKGENKIRFDQSHYGFARFDGKGTIEQGIDLTTKGGAFAGEMIVANIEPIQDWREDDSRYFFRMSGPDLSIHNPYQEEYLMYAHHMPLSEPPKVDLYEEDITINPVLKSASGKGLFEAYMETTGQMATVETDRPSSHTHFFLLDQELKVWRVSVTEDGAFVTRRAFELDGKRHEEFKGVYLYDRHNLYMSELQVGLDGVLKLGRAFHYVVGEQTKPMHLNEFRFVKRVWGLELGRKKLLSKQTYKAYMNDYNRKLGKWQAISPDRQYYIYFASSGGQLFLTVRDLNAIGLSSQNSLDRYNMSYADVGMNLPTSSMFLLTDGMDHKFLPIEDWHGERIGYTLSVDERGSLVSEAAHIGSSSTTNARIKE